MTKAILVGRFQPFTRGHLYAVNYLKSKFEPVEIGVSVPFVEKLDEDNPFPVLWRSHWASMATSLNVRVVCGYNPLFLPEGYFVAVGADRKRSMEVMKESRPEWKYVIVPRHRFSISATMAREALRNGDMERFKEVVPESLHGEWDNMLRYITQ